MPENQSSDPWDAVDAAGNPIENFKYIELEFLFDREIEATHISEMIVSIVEDFDTAIVDAEIVWDKDDPESSGEGGAAFYDIYPNQPGLLEAFQEQLKGLNVEITSWPTTRGI